MNRGPVYVYYLIRHPTLSFRKVREIRVWKCPIVRQFDRCLSSIGTHALDIIQNATINYPDSKVHGANTGPTWVLPAPDGPHLGLMNLAIRVPIPWHRKHDTTSRLTIDILMENTMASCALHTWSRTFYGAVFPGLYCFEVAPLSR